MEATRWVPLVGEVLQLFGFAGLLVIYRGWLLRASTVMRRLVVDPPPQTVTPASRPSQRRVGQPVLEQVPSDPVLAAVDRLERAVTQHGKALDVVRDEQSALTTRVAGWQESIHDEVNRLTQPASWRFVVPASFALVGALLSAWAAWPP